MTLAHARRVVEEAQVRVRGDLQMHTTWSDGGSSVEQMARAAADLGYDYIALTDHSARGLPIVKGLDEDRLAAQAREIRRVNADLDGLVVLRSIEMNLTPAGDGDLDPAALATLDLVLGSFHSQLRKTEDQTERYLAALANPDVNVLAHPRGRIYDFRLGLSCDWPRVFDAAAAADRILNLLPVEELTGWARSARAKAA